MTIKEQLEELLEKQLGHSDFVVDKSKSFSRGHYTTSVAIKYKLNAITLAKELKHELLEQVEVKNGFVNFFIKREYLFKEIFAPRDSLKKTMQGERIIVEYGHPNTHKEMHIGHLRTLLLGESLARILEASGATVFRANYQGDIGLHVAKAVWAIKKNFLLYEKKDNKSEFLGRAYIIGSKAYETRSEYKQEIDSINQYLYANQGDFVYQVTRSWSLDDFSDWYHYFDVNFDKLFFESEMVHRAREIIDNNKMIFKKSEGAIIFGRSPRVYITSNNLPTYEAKDLANAYKQQEAFPSFTKRIHVVGNEQKDYFINLFEALALIAPSDFGGKLYHLPMGMVTLMNKKMSSRTGSVLSVQELVDMVHKTMGEDLAKATIAYGLLSVNPHEDVSFDIIQASQTTGDTGVYLQYTYARANRVIEKDGDGLIDYKYTSPLLLQDEEELLHALIGFPDTIKQSALRQNPALIARHLRDIANKFNKFYNGKLIMENGLRLSLTEAVVNYLHWGLELLLIPTLKKI